MENINSLVLIFIIALLIIAIILAICLGDETTIIILAISMIYIGCFMHVMMQPSYKSNTIYNVSVYRDDKLEEVYTGWDITINESKFQYTDKNGVHTINFSGKSLKFQNTKEK